MMNDPEIEGRFLPSRAYRRWKWTVRSGLVVLPLVLFLSGVVQLYLTPGKYRSTTVFEIASGPPPDELAHLLKAEKLLGEVVSKLHLPDRMGFDRQNGIDAIRDNLAASVVPGTGMVKLDVTLTRASDARDLAAELPAGLVRHLDALRRQVAEGRLFEIHRLLRNAEDRLAERRTHWIKLQQIHGPSPAEAAAATAIDQARQATNREQVEIDRLSALRLAEETSLVEKRPSLLVHAEPTIGSSPVTPNTGKELGLLIVRSLGIGLLAALLIPYLLELALPPPSTAARISRGDEDFPQPEFDTPAPDRITSTP